MEFSYRIAFIGEVEARLADERTAATVTASWVTEDALGDLLEALVHLLEGAAETRCSWEEEPGEYRWIFIRTRGQVELRVLGFADLDDHEPDEHGRLVFATRQDPQTLVSVIADGITAMLAEYGEAGYQEWMDPFPAQTFARLQQLLITR
jgi:hypothetical protein